MGGIWNRIDQVHKIAGHNFDRQSAATTSRRAKRRMREINPFAPTNLFNSLCRIKAKGVVIHTHRKSRHLYQKVLGCADLNNQTASLNIPISHGAIIANMNYPTYFSRQ